MFVKNSHCSFCGFVFVDESWPRNCSSCSNITYRNPLPVTVILCSVTDGFKAGLVLVKRSIEPHSGEWALPGGYLDVGETWQEGSMRELREETGIDLPVTRIIPGLTRVVTALSNSNLLIFCTAWIEKEKVPAFVPNHEVSEMKIAYSPTPLAFPTHSDMADSFFARRS